MEGMKLRRIVITMEGLNYEPDPRYAPFFATFGEEVHVWGGKLKAASSCLQVYHSCVESWRLLHTPGPAPPGLYAGASARWDRYLYVYGGVQANQSCCGCLHRLDTTNFAWSQLTPKCTDLPMKKWACKMVVYQNFLVLVGGRGLRNRTGRAALAGSDWTKARHADDERDPRTEGYTNEMHKFNLKEGTWQSISSTGSRPPPCSNFTLTKITENKAVLIGGGRPGFRNTDVYILDLPMMHWTVLLVRAREATMPGRSGHSTVCLGYDGKKPQLVVTGGVDRAYNVFNDVWLLDVQSGRWNEVQVPNLQSRHAHISAAFSLSPGTTEVVLFGGVDVFPPQPNAFVANTTVLRFERGQEAEWILTDVADASQRGTSERIREKMARLSALTHETSRREQDLEHQLQEQEAQASRTSRQAEARLKKAAKQCEKLTRSAERHRRDAERCKEEVEQLAQELKKRTAGFDGSEKQWLMQKSEVRMASQSLGLGGWGEVKVAYFRGSKVAAKILHKDLQSPYYHDAFIREMNMAARVRHPNLVQFIGATMDSEMIILMELMPTSLHRYLTSSSPAVPASSVCISIALDVARALNYLHLMQPHPIIHRDIGSSNVLLEPLPNQAWRAKVTDYGSVNFTNKLKTENPGSPVYSAPEVSMPTSQTTKMDIFSFGVLLLELCTNHFPGVEGREALMASLREHRWCDLIRQCLQQDMEIRPHAASIITQLTFWQQQNYRDEVIDTVVGFPA